MQVTWRDLFLLAFYSKLRWAQSDGFIETTGTAKDERKYLKKTGNVENDMKNGNIAVGEFYKNIRIHVSTMKQIGNKIKLNMLSLH